MLVLSRKPGETIIIGDNIRISVVSIAPGRVKIGIDAPKEVTIQREELLDRPVVASPAPAPQVAEDTVTTPQPAANAPAIHNRILDKFPTPAVAPAPAKAESTPALENRIAKLRRKPR